MMRLLGKLLAAFGIAAASTAAAEKVEWPELPKSGFVSGRAATVQDFETGEAIFSMDGKSEGPLALEVPQYALWKDEDGIDHPVIVMQTEKAPDGTEIVGLQNLDGSNMVATLPELTLLGTAKPN